MANSRKLIVQIVGDDDSLRRAFRRSSTGAANFDRSISRATRGALAGSGVFRGLGRSIAFASGGFLAFASAGQFLRTSIDAAKEAAVVQAQLAAQFKSSGKDLAQYQGAIDKTANRLSLLAGFENDELKSAFVTIFRATGNVSKALRDTGLAADIARAKHIDLSKASTLVAKVEAGNVGILRRQGVQIAKNATVEQALTIARLKFLGQARAGTTEQERFGAVLHNTEEIIGTGLLPTLNKYLARASIWLTQMNDSGKLQRDVAAAAHGVGEASAAVSTVFRGLNKITGSTANSLKTLAGVFLILEARAKLIKWGLISTGIRGVGKAAVVASAEVGGLRAALLGLRGPAAILGGLAIGIEALRRDAASKVTLGTSRGRGGAAGTVISQNGKFFIVSPQNAGRGGPGGLRPITKDEALKLIGAVASRTTGPAVRGLDSPFRFTPPASKTAAAAAKGLSLAGQFNLAELRLAKASLTAISSDDRAILVTEAAIVRQQIEQTKKLKDRIAKTQQLAGILSQVRSIDSDIAAKNKAAADAAKERAKAARELREAFTVPLGLQLGAAKAGATVTTADDLNVAKKIRSAAQKALKSGRLALQGQIDAWNTIAAANDQLRAAVTGPETTFLKLSARKFLASIGVGLDAAEFRRFRAGFSQVGAGGTVPRHGVGAFGVAFPTGDIVVHHTSILDGRPIERSVTRHQQKRKARNPSQRRGPHAGGGL